MTGDPYIMPHERRVLTVRQHPLTILGKPAAVTVLAFAAAVSVTAASPAAAVRILAWLAFAAAAGRTGWLTARWAMTYLILTNLRLLVVDGVFTRRVSMIPLVKVVDMNFERPLLGMWLGYGQLTIEGAHETHPLRRVGPLPRIDEVYTVICGMLFSDPENEEPRSG